MKKLILALSLVGISAFAAFAQTPTPTPKPIPNDDDVVKISTTLIQVDVTVTDKKGKIVTDLKPEEFEIYENGEKQNLSNFSFVSTEPDVAASPASTPNKNEVGIPLPPVQIRPEQVRRTIALVVDDLGISFESMHFVRRALKKYVDEQMQPTDLVAIIRTGGGIGALQQFTSDKNQLYAAIEKIRWNPQGRAGVGAFAPIEPTALENAQTAGAEVSEEDIQEDKDRTAAFNQLRDDLFAVGTLGAINFVVKGMGELPGRKSIMLFSDGITICPEAATRNQNIDCQRIKDSMKQLTDLANRAAVTIYAQDSRGLQTLGITAADNLPSGPTAQQDALRARSVENWDKQEGLGFLASETGGRAFFNNNDFNQSIDRALEDQKGFYLLGYQPDTDTFDAQKRKFNKLTVKVTRPGVNVRYRSGFFGVADKVKDETKTTQSTAVQKIQTALMSPFAVNEINLKLNTLFGFNPKTGSFSNSLLHVNAADLSFTDAADGKKQATFDVLAVSFGDNGTVIDTIGKNYTLTVSKEGYANLLKEGFVYHFIFPVKKPNSFQMRVAIRDTTSSKVGSASQFVEIPDLKKKKLTLSSLVLENFTLKQWDDLSNNPTARRETDPMTDTSLRRFKRGSILRYGLEIYNSKEKQNIQQLQTRIRVIRDGKILFERPFAPLSLEGQTDKAKINYTGALSLGTELTAGDYVLQVIVMDSLAKKKNQIATKWVQFELVE